MRNIILFTFLLLLSNHGLSQELSLDNIKSDFKETIDHYNYNLNKEKLQNSPKTQRVRTKNSTVNTDNEILNLENEFNEYGHDEVKLKAAGLKKTNVPTKRARFR